MKYFYIVLFLSFSSLLSNDKIILQLNNGSTQEIILSEIEKFSFQTEYIPVEIFEITTNDVILYEGDSQFITTNISPENATNKKITWLSIDESIAKVDDEGTIIGISEGTTTIIGSSEMRNIVDSLDVEVKKLSSVRLNNPKFNIFPNPASSKITIETENNLPFEVIISDIEGNIVYSEYDKKEINISHLSNSTYIVYINQNNRYYSYKLIKN